MAKLTLNTIGSRYGSVEALNDNFDAIEQALENTFSLDGTSPNALEADLDMNSNDILNAGEVSTETLRINGVLVEPFVGVTAGPVFQTYEFTATAGQTTFSVSPATPQVSSINVFVNGLQLSPSEISVSTTNVILPAMTAGDEVVIRRYTVQPAPVPDATNINFIQAGTGAVTRTSQDKMREAISVKDYGATGNGSTDDTAAIQAAIDANPGGTIVFPRGIYRVSSTITINTNGTQLSAPFGRASIYSPAGNFDIFHFTCFTNGQYEYLSNCGLTGNFYIYADNTSVATAGAGVRLTRCSNFTMREINILNVPEGLIIEGGQDCMLHGLRLALNPLTPDRTGTANSALIKILESPTAGGTYQPAYTVRITNFQASANYRTQNTLFVGNVDGLQITNAYLSGGKNAVVRLKNLRAGSYIAAITASDLYLDAVNQSTGANTCIDIPDDTLASNVYNVDFSNCFFGNCVTDAVTVTKTTTELKFTGCTFANVNGTAVNFSGSAANAGNLTLTGNKIQSTGVLAGASSAVRIGNSGSVNIVGNKIDSHAGTNSAIRLDGTIADATIVGNGVRMSSGTDFQNVGTVARLVLAGNDSNLATSALQGVRTGNKTNADGNVLDWYEEGTFTPTVTFGGLSTGITYGAQIGEFTRVGNRVHFNLRMLLTSKGSATGAMLINGLPYANVNPTALAHRLNNITAGLGELSAFIGSGSTSVQLGKMGAAAVSFTQFTDADVRNDLDVQIAGTYRV